MSVDLYSLMLSFEWLALALRRLSRLVRELIPSGNWLPAGSMELRALAIEGGLGLPKWRIWN